MTERTGSSWKTSRSDAKANYLLAAVATSDQSKSSPLTFWGYASLAFPLHQGRCKRVELACAYALQVLPTSEVAAAEAHIAACPDCQRELESLRPVVDSFVSWPTDVLRPTTSLQARLALRIAEETGKEPMLPPARRWSEPEWEQVAPGIECKLLATDAERHRVSMLVHLALGASYPAHTQAGVEGSTRASSSRATTTTVRLERATSASGARLAAPVFSSRAPRMFCADYGEPPHLG